MISENKKGVTLMEIVIAMVILGFLMVAANQMMGIFVGASNINSKNYDLQSTARISASTVKTSINNATSIFLLNDAAFLPVNRTDGWNYIGVERVGNYDEIVQYVYNGTTHERRMLGKGEEGTSIAMSFSKVENDAKKISVTFTVRDEDGHREVLLDTSFESLNASSIVDWATGNGSSAFAYRTEGFDVSNGTTVVHDPALIGFTLDRSGSMNGTMAGPRTSNLSLRRTYFLRQALYDFVTRFQNTPEVYITSNAYDHRVQAAHVKSPKLLSGSDLAELLNMFSPDNYTGAGGASYTPGYVDFLNADSNGATNGGEGLRILYHQMNGNLPTSIYTAPPGVSDMRKMYIVVTDGLNNCVSTENSASGPLYFGPQFGYTGNIVINQYADSNPISGNYMLSVVAHVRANEDSSTDYFAIAIGDEQAFFPSLGAAFGHGVPGSEAYETHMFTAQTADQLEAAFTSIMNTVSMQIELLRGPKR